MDSSGTPAPQTMPAFAAEPRTGNPPETASLLTDPVYPCGPSDGDVRIKAPQRPD
jgi:hypothetical protein